MKKLKIFSIVVVVMTFFVFSYNINLGDTDWTTEKIKQAYDSTILLKVKTTTELDTSDENVFEQKLLERLKQEGKATTSVDEYTTALLSLGNKEFVTLKHCVVPDSKSIVPIQLPNGNIVPLHIKLIKVELFILYKGFEVPTELVGIYKDIALLKADWDIPKYPIEFDKEFDIKLGQKILVIGYSDARFVNLKDGIVSVLTLNDKKSEEYGDAFVTSIDTNHGDSGCPVITRVKGGEYKIIGLIQRIEFMEGTQIQLHGVGIAITSKFVLKALDIIRKESNSINGKN